MDTLLSVSHVSYSYHTLSGETPALSDITFSVKEGEFLSIVGPSGCGKSTLLSLLASLMEPESGTIILRGKPLAPHTANIGYMLQKIISLNGAPSTGILCSVWRFRKK